MRRAARATAIGGIAIILWSALALLTTATRGLPPFEVLACSFAVAAASGLAWLIAVQAVAGGERLGRMLVPWPGWALGFCGLFFYHALYFVALGNAPPGEASLVAYLWPLLIVLFAALLPGGRLRASHLAGAACGLAGTALLVLGRAGAAPVGGSPVLGFAAACGCALVWSAYSVLNRRFADQPSEALVGMCAGVAACGLAAHLGVEATVWPDRTQALALLGLGFGPVGLAFLAWDHATKRGHLALLGTLAYLAPLLSTALLIAAGRTAPRAEVVLAAVLIIAGAALAARAR